MAEFKLRRVFLKNISSLSKMSAEWMAIQTIKTWNAVISGKKMKILKVAPGEARPKILKGKNS